MFLFKRRKNKKSKTNYYSVQEDNVSKKKAIVKNYKTGRLEIYSTVLSEAEILAIKNFRELQVKLLKKRLRERKRRIREKLIEKKKQEYLKEFNRLKELKRINKCLEACKKVSPILTVNEHSLLREQFLEYQKVYGKLRLDYTDSFYFYNKYQNYYFLSKNNSFNSLIIASFFKRIKGNILWSRNNFLRFYYYNLTQSFKKKKDKDKQRKINIISIYVNLRRSNIFITVMDVTRNKILKVLSPRIFPHISKKGRKKSASYFYTVKRTLMYLSRYIRRNGYFFKVYFKGFLILRRPLIFRFLYDKKFKAKCIGIYNIDFESFNGCRLKKKKRIKIRGSRKQKKRFSL